MNHPSEGTLLVRSVSQLLNGGRQHDLAGRTSEAMECYAAVIDLASAGDQRALAEALRRLAVLHHFRRISFCRTPRSA